MPDPGEASCTIATGSVTSVGAFRKVNEESYLTGRSVFVVADGMGGHECGQQASSSVVDAFAPLAKLTWVAPCHIGGAIATACRQIAGLAKPGTMPPGSTLVGASIFHLKGVPTWVLFNVGDSRAYLMRGPRLEQISVDHSRVQQMVDEGVSRAIAERAVKRNVITRALGVGKVQAPAVDRWLLPVLVGDRLLLCSDGLTNEINDQKIHQLMVSILNPQELAAELVNAALHNGGHDNITAVVADAMSVVVGASRDDEDDVQETVPEEIW